jgi:hypothetical protein
MRFAGTKKKMKQNSQAKSFKTISRKLFIVETTRMALHLKINLMYGSKHGMSPTDLIQKLYLMKSGERQNLLGITITAINLSFLYLLC